MIAPPAYAAAVLRGIGAPVTPQNIAGFIGWSQAEGPLGSDNWRGNNPLNTTQNAPGARSRNSVGVKAYPNPQVGIQATVQTLKNGHYGGILQAFRANNPHALPGAIGASPWGTSGSLAAQTIAAALGQHYAVPAGAAAAMTPAGAPSPKARPTTDTIGGGTDYAALAQSVLAREAARPITSGLHGNPLGAYASALSSGLFKVPTTQVAGSPAPAAASGGSVRRGNFHAGLGAGDINPLGNGWTIGRVDQGADANAAVGTPIHALNDSRVVRIDPNWYKGQPLVLMQLTAGPNRGKYWYVSEQIAHGLHVGSAVPRGAIVARYAPSGTGIEIGWGSPASGGSTLATAPGHGGYSEGRVTPEGLAFLHKILKR